MIQLMVCKPPSDEEKKELNTNQIMIGRDPKNEIVLNDTDVSRVHCSIFFDKDKWRIKDLKSTNGTFLNGIPVREHAIKPGDVIIVGKCRLHYQESSEMKGGVAIEEQKNLANRVIHKIDPQSSLLWAHEQETVEIDRTDMDQYRSAINVLRRGYSYLSPMFVLEEISRREYTTEEMAQKAAQSIMDIFTEVEFCALHLLNPRTQAPEHQAVASYPPELAANISIDQSIRDQVLKERMAILAEADVESQEGEGKSVPVMCAPLLAGGHCVGYLYAGNISRGDCFEKIDLELFSLFALQLGISFDNMAAFGKTRKRCEDLLSTADRASLLQQILIGKDRHSQINTVAGINLSDVQSILQKIKGVSAKLDEEIPRAHQARTTVNELVAETDIAIARLENLLAYCRRGKVHVARFHPTKLIDEIIDLTKGIVGDNIWVEADLADDLPLLEFDAVLFEQILIRLIMVARNAMIEGGMLKIAAVEKEIDAAFVKSRKALRPGPAIELVIETTGGLEISGEAVAGTGISPDDLDSIQTVREIMRVNSSWIDIKNLSSGSRISLYFMQSAVG